MSIESEHYNHHVSVCICTYKRPQMLSNLLNNLQTQETIDQFTYSVIVVDNDIDQSAKDVVKKWQERSAFQIAYFHEPEQNIALARNKAVENAKGNFFAFIDDDEFPAKNWLINLFQTMQKNKCAGVLGPVKPFFEFQPPQWIIKSRICERPSYPTGTVLKNHNETRTGNVLLNKMLFSNDRIPFNPEYGRTGGEDVDFFCRKIKQGFTFLWCNEASVYEIVPPERFTKMYYIKKALLRGKVNAAKSKILSIDTAKSVIAFVLYTVTLPFLAIVGQHLFMKYLIKDCDHLGKLMGLIGIKIVTNR